MATLTAPHRRRLRELWRSAGWPCRDGLEIDLLAAGLLRRHLDDQGRETLHLTEPGVQELALTLQRNRAAFNAHEALVARVALEMQHAGRMVWRGLRLRAALPAHSDTAADADADAHPETAAEPVARRWALAMPDVYSIRHTTVEDYTEPVVHEIKVRRADLLADLRRADKGAAYRALSSQCWYVLARGIADEAEVPEAYGVMWAQGDTLSVARPAPRRALRVPFAVWMALARATAEPPPEDRPQSPLTEESGARAEDHTAALRP